MKLPRTEIALQQNVYQQVIKLTCHYHRLTSINELTTVKSYINPDSTPTLDNTEGKWNNCTTNHFWLIKLPIEIMSNVYQREPVLTWSVGFDAQRTEIYWCVIIWGRIHIFLDTSLVQNGQLKTLMVWIGIPLVRTSGRVDVLPY